MEYVVFSSSANIDNWMWDIPEEEQHCLSNFKWTPPNEADLFTCEITGEHALHWCENGYPDLCNC